MKISPVRFDDLAFILLFFFMIVSVISFSNSAIQKQQTLDITETKEELSSEENSETISVFLDENGNLSITEFQEGDFVELECSPSVNWKVIQDSVHFISDQGATVTLVIE